MQSQPWRSEALYRALSLSLPRIGSAEEVVYVQCKITGDVVDYVTKHFSGKRIFYSSNPYNCKGMEILTEDQKSQTGLWKAIDVPTPPDTKRKMGKLIDNMKDDWPHCGTAQNPPDPFLKVWGKGNLPRIPAFQQIREYMTDIYSDKFSSDYSADKDVIFGEDFKNRINALYPKPASSASAAPAAPCPVDDPKSALQLKFEESDMRIVENLIIAKDIASAIMKTKSGEDLEALDSIVQSLLTEEHEEQEDALKKSEDARTMAKALADKNKLVEPIFNKTWFQNRLDSLIKAPYGRPGVFADAANGVALVHLADLEEGGTLVSVDKKYEVDIPAGILERRGEKPTMHCLIDHEQDDVFALKICHKRFKLKVYLCWDKQVDTAMKFVNAMQEALNSGKPRDVEIMPADSLIGEVNFKKVKFQYETMNFGWKDSLFKALPTYVDHLFKAPPM